MTKTKCLHIIYPEKFFKDYVAFVNRNFKAEEHTFLYLKTNGTEPTATNVTRLKYYRWGLLFYYELYQYINSSECVVLHSLLKNKVIYFLFLFPRFRKKCCWFLWGGDMYYRLEKFSKPVHNWLYAYIFKRVVNGLGSAATHISGDVELARKKLGFTGQHIHCFLYPSNYFRPIAPIDSSRNPTKKIIMVGNSAHASNNHLAVFEKLVAYKNEIEIICPLSYGNKRYAALVKLKGKELFGDNFRALDGFLPLTEYLQILNSIDIAIFNNWRQQGVGNIINLLGMGKTLYLRSDTTTWGMLKKEGLHIFDFCIFSALQQLTSEEKSANQATIQNTFTEANLITQSFQVFQSSIA